MSILIIEDHPVNLGAVCSVINKSFPSESIKIAKNHSDGGIHLKKAEWRAILLDLKLQGSGNDSCPLGGIELFNEMTRVQQGRTIVMTGILHYAEAKEQMIENGLPGDHFLVRPYSTIQLIDLLERLLG